MVTVHAIRLHFMVWLRRWHGALTLRLTQVLSGHGCFGGYLCRLGRELSALCHHCGCDVDDAQPTLAVCPVWESPCRVMIAATGLDLSLSNGFKSMVNSESGWISVASFCKLAMLVKELAEREREWLTGRVPSCSWRTRRRQIRDDLQPP